MLEWTKLLNYDRRKSKDKSPTKEKKEIKEKETRTEIERDYDRILFSTPVRRLADKTQVFPLERNDSVRTRLTHSHEVANLARSIGVDLTFNEKLSDPSLSLNLKRNIPSMLAAVGLAHDLGNPPFGHNGERSIQSWFEKDKFNVFSEEHGETLTDSMKKDFLKFEGNAQTLRLLTRLQLISDDYGLNLTYGTLAALMKYPISSDKVDKKHVAKKKHGFFQSEKKIVKEIWANTGLSEGIRHPLTYIMEACDDIAYSVLDTEDAVKKSLVSFPDVIVYLEHEGGSDSTVKKVIKLAMNENAKNRSEKISPRELNDISMQMFRVHAINAMIGGVKDAFTENYDKILKGEFGQDLIGVSASNRLCSLLKSFDVKYAFKHRSVLELELIGHNTITKLMDYFWHAVTHRESYEKLDSARKTPFASYVYSRISENYRRVFESETNDMLVRYKELQLITDMISGMTDSYAVSLLEELKKHHGDNDN